jgi:oleate hydratase
VDYTDQVPRSGTRAYLVGGGIASLASAAYLISVGGVPGENIHIFEETRRFGGSLDGAGSPEAGYSIRGGRMFTYEAYTCTFDLLSFIPSLGDPLVSVKDEIYAFNLLHVSHACARLVRGGKKVDTSMMGFSNRDRLDLLQLMASSEEALGARRIEELFEPAFFTTNFWYMWVTTFAFQPWHSAIELRRYMRRFIQEFPRIDTLGGVRRTPYNQYDSIVLPLLAWLKAQGVQFVMGTQVTEVQFVHGATGKRVERLRCYDTAATRELAVGADGHGIDETPRDIAVGPDDLVFITNGSMTAASSLGSMTAPAPLHPDDAGGCWKLWETLAGQHTGFGRPSVFNSHVDESKWISFTVTMRDPLFFDLMERFSGNEAGTGGLVTITDSNWLMSVVLATQPHFIGQPDDVTVFWGYGLFVDQPGNFVAKKMSECTGEELLRELLGHLRFTGHEAEILAVSNCIPCMMPYITSQFMPRVAGERPLVRPVGTSNFAFIGQYCEIPDDVVFTVEYSVRSAQTAVFSLLQIDREVSPIYKGEHEIGVLLSSMKEMTS